MNHLEVEKKYNIDWMVRKAKENKLYILCETLENWYILIQSPSNETLFVGYHSSGKRTKPYANHVKTTKMPKTKKHVIFIDDNKINKYMTPKRVYDDYQACFFSCNFYIVPESQRDLLLEIDPLLSKYISKLSDEDYQIIIENAIGKGTYCEDKKTNIVKRQRIANQYARDIQAAAFAKQQAGYKCEFNKEHKTFISNISREQYVEAHHLIPMKFQDEFKVSLDISENIVALCPNCHRAIHYGTKDVKREMISVLFNNREEFLKNNGINIDIKKLLEMINSQAART